MIGVLTNSALVIIGSLIGIIFKKYITKDIGDTLMKALGLCVIYVGITGVLKGENTLIIILSIALGTLIGSFFKLEDKFSNFVKNCESRFIKKDISDDKISFSEGFINASLLFCVGAMAVVGSLQAGISGDNSTLFTKSMLDGITSIIFASTMGIGVLFSCVTIFIYQGAIVIFANFISPFLNTQCVAEMTAAGSLLIIAIGFNMLGITKIKIMDMLPAVFIPIILCLFM